MARRSEFSLEARQRAVRLLKKSWKKAPFERAAICSSAITPAAILS